jgi:N-methylhydantoinase A/oxoprolinase/acetone carboxylase beta subunit
MHAAAIADEMGIDRIVVPRAAGVLSALGLAAADRRRDEAETVMRHVDAGVDDLARDADEVSFDVRYRGQSHELTVRGADVREAFEAAHEERYGYRDPEAEVEVVTVRRSWIDHGPALEWEGEQRLEGTTLVVPDGWSARWDGDVVRVER